MPYSVERLLEVREDTVKALLVLQGFLTGYSKNENLLSCAPSCSEPACSSLMISSACVFGLFRILSMTLLGCLLRLIGCLPLGE